MWSVDKTITGNDLSLGSIDIGAGWIFNNGVFVNAYVAWIKDFEIDETFVNAALSLGWNFSIRWSASIGYDDTNYFVPGAIVEVQGGLVRQWALNLHYNF